MSNRVELFDEELDAVSGGNITYTWDGEIGSIGLNGNNPFVLHDKDAFVEYFNSVQGTKTDAEILTDLIHAGIVTKK